MDILKWLCGKNDVFFTLDDHIKFMDKIYNVFNGTKKEFFEAQKLNEKKQKYYLNKFVLKQKQSLFGDWEDEYKEDMCHLRKQQEIQVKPGNYAFFDYSMVCWQCGKNVNEDGIYKQCPEYICQTKYCEDCCKEVFNAKDNVHCHMCRKVPNGKFTVIDSKKGVLYQSEEYKDKLHPLQTDRAKRQWEMGLKSVDGCETSDDDDDDISISDSDSESSGSESESVSMLDGWYYSEDDLTEKGGKKDGKAQSKSQGNIGDEVTTGGKGRKSHQSQKDKEKGNKDGNKNKAGNKDGSKNKAGKGRPRKWRKKDKVQANKTYQQTRKTNFKPKVSNQPTSFVPQSTEPRKKSPGQVENLRVRRKNRRKARKRKRRKEKRDKKAKEAAEINGMLDNMGKDKDNGKKQDTDQDGKNKGKQTGGTNKNGKDSSENKNKDKEMESDEQDDDLKENRNVKTDDKKDKNENKSKTTEKEQGQGIQPAPNIPATKVTYNFMTRFGSSNSDPITKAKLDCIKDGREKIQFIGDRLHPKVIQYVNNRANAARITSMLISIQEPKLLDLVTDDAKLAGYIETAIDIVNKKTKRNRVSSSGPTPVTAAQIKARVVKMKAEQQEQIQRITTTTNTGSGNVNTGSRSGPGLR